MSAVQTETASSLFRAGTPVDFARPIDRSILQGRTALVTGAGSGIGLGIATALAESGAHVTFADINEAAAAQAVASLKSHGYAAQYVKTDVTVWEEQVAAFALAAKSSRDQTVDIVVSAAGITTTLAKQTLPNDQDTPLKPPTTTIDINLIGTYFSTALARWYFTHSPPSAAKSLLFIASMASYAPAPGGAYRGQSADYTLSKFGVRGLWQQLRTRGKDNGGARFNLLAPYFIDTPMLKDVKDLLAAGSKVATVEDAVQGAMRCLCDIQVQGRAIVVCSGEANGGPPGSANFDVKDELVTGSGAMALGESAWKFNYPAPSST